MARGDVVRKAEREGKELFCKPCRNKSRFEDKSHPRKGKGVKNNPALEYTRRSYYKAKRRCKMGKDHHPCYENIEFRLNSLQELIDDIGVRPDGLTLDRINPLGHYEKGNLRWATAKQQAENKLPRGYWN